MSSSRDQIAAHRDQARNELSSNLRELERRAVSAMDWRQQFAERPGTLLAVAFGSGIALSLLLGGGGGRRRQMGESAAVGTYGPGGHPEFWDQVKGALIGVAAARVTGYVAQLFPEGEEAPRRAEVPISQDW